MVGRRPLSRAKHVADADAAVRRGDVVAAETSNMLASQVRLERLPADLVANIRTAIAVLAEDESGRQNQEIRRLAACVNWSREDEFIG